MNLTLWSRRFARSSPQSTDAEPTCADAVPMTFRQFVTKVRPSFVWYRHCVELAAVLQRVADGHIKRLMVFEPPRHGKSELASRLFPAYLMYRFPADEIGLCSYSASLAVSLSADARGNYKQIGGTLSRASNAKRDWRNILGGRCWAEGVGGSLTGKGFKWGIIDDPIKGAKEATSDTIKRNLREWYQAVFYTRQAPDAAIIIINTRWAEDDLAGWQLDEEKMGAAELAATILEGNPVAIAEANGALEHWHIVNMQAIRDLDEVAEFPSSCTVEPDWRQHGEALCPERYPVGRLRRVAKRIGDYFWAALFQQKPVPSGGGVFKPAWFGNRIHISNVPRLVKLVIGVDLAFDEKADNDYTVAIPLGVDAGGRYYMFRPYRAQAEAPDALMGIATRSQEVNARTIGVEDVSAQKAYIQLLRQKPEMYGRAIIGIKADTDKLGRARGWSPIAQQGLITMVVDGTGWEDTWLEEARHFPRSKNDDQVDAVGMAFAAIASINHGGAAAATDEVAKALKEGLR